MHIYLQYQRSSPRDRSNRYSIQTGLLILSIKPYEVCVAVLRVIRPPVHVDRSSFRLYSVSRIAAEVWRGDTRSSRTLGRGWGRARGRRTKVGRVERPAGGAFTTQTWQRLLALSCSTGATTPPAPSIYTVCVRVYVCVRARLCVCVYTCMRARAHPANLPSRYVEYTLFERGIVIEMNESRWRVMETKSRFRPDATPSSSETFTFARACVCVCVCERAPSFPEQRCGISRAGFYPSSRVIVDEILIHAFPFCRSHRGVLAGE